MALLGTLTTAYRDERSQRRPRRHRPLLVLTAQALGRSAARIAPRVAALRTALLSVAGFTLIDTGVWEWNRIIGLITTGASLLILEALTSSGGDHA